MITKSWKFKGFPGQKCPNGCRKKPASDWEAQICGSTHSVAKSQRK